MKLHEIYKFLDTLSPFELQEKWDNSGLIVGDMSREVSEVVVSLDVDEALVEEAKEGTLFVVHHPLIFGKLTQLNFETYPANFLEKMILKKQSCIAMHTNIDQTHLNRYVFSEVLGFEVAEEKPFLLTSHRSWEYQPFMKHLKEKLGLSVMKVVGKKEYIGSVALTTGAGASLLESVDADCFLTGDIKYHDAMKALSENKMLVEIGHYESEQFFAPMMARLLKVLPLLVIMANSKNPFEYDDSI
jgi:dinuclear metal center YbgI/SA1388 family protein